MLQSCFGIDKVLGLQFSLLNGSTHDIWLQQGNENAALDEQMQSRCEVLTCKKTADSGRRRPARPSEVCSCATSPATDKV